MSTIYQLLASAADKVGAIGKNKKMEAGPAKYAYRGVDDVIQAVHPVFAELGIVMAPRVEAVIFGEMPTRNGGAMRLCTMTVAFDFYGPEGDSVTVTTIGEATDSGDKSPNKAHTGALKVALCQLLLIPFDSQDPDDDRLEHQTSSSTAPNDVLPASDHQESRSPQKDKPKPPAATERVCANCNRPIEAGEAMTKKRGKFAHTQCAADQAATEAVKETFPGAETVGTDKTQYTEAEMETF